MKGLLDSGGAYLSPKSIASIGGFFAANQKEGSENAKAAAERNIR